jgi:hypothetical protein
MTTEDIRLPIGISGISESSGLSPPLGNAAIWQFWMRQAPAEPQPKKECSLDPALGHLPKYDEESAKAWLYGKLFVALLTEKLIHHACAVSPWGYLLEVASLSQPMA